jgi:DNA-binding LytR/AlgR family response regulator
MVMKTKIFFRKEYAETFIAMKTNLTSANTITFDYGKKTVPFEQITYFKSEFGNYTKVHMQENKNYLSSFTLKYYSAKLDDLDLFIVPRKGLLINRTFIKTIDQSPKGIFLVMKTGERFKEEIVRLLA